MSVEVKTNDDLPDLKQDDVEVCRHLDGEIHPPSL